MMSNHTCPYGGMKSEPYPRGTRTADLHNHRIVVCGQRGWLCDMCREDQADIRTDHLQEVISDCADRLVEGLALAGLLANPNTAKLSADDIESGAPRTAARMAAALREREGGE